MSPYFKQTIWHVVDAEQRTVMPHIIGLDLGQRLLPSNRIRPLNRHITNGAAD